MDTQNTLKLKRLTINGYKSFSDNEHSIDFGDITVLIGANGAGKSNLVSFFKMIGYMMNTALQQFVGDQGGASSLLNFGQKVTPTLSAKVIFGIQKGLLQDSEDLCLDYKFSLSYGAKDTLYFTKEIVSFYSERKNSMKTDYEFPSGFESRLKLDELHLEHFESGSVIIPLLQNFTVYQFNDTTSTSKFKSSCYINQDNSLNNDGGNLSAFLYGLKENEKNRPYYNKIVRHIKQIFPQFGDFVLQPSARNENMIFLKWHEQNHVNYELGAHQLSDGILRFMALAALLLQPPHNLPSVIMIDEPELGLHPAAITELASMVKIASQYSQIILATQNPALLDEFLPEQITVIERDPISKSSIFKKLTSEELNDWLTDYTLSELWDKNILGGRP